MVPAARRTPASDGSYLERAASGDDYELLFTAPPALSNDIFTLCQRLNLRLTRIGSVLAGDGLSVLGLAGDPIVPARLGYEHGVE